MGIHFSNQPSAISRQQSALSKDPFHRNGTQRTQRKTRIQKGFFYSFASVASFAVK
jgi:hypothetical protein